MRYLLLLLLVFLPLWLNSATVKATGFVTVRIISAELMINSDNIISNNLQANQVVYSYIENNTINFVF
jgi:hypothetical protein